MKERAIEVDCGENMGVWGFSVHGIEWHSIIKYIYFYVMVVCVMEIVVEYSRLVDGDQIDGDVRW